MSPGEATFKYPISEGCEGDKQRDNSRLSASPSGFASCVAFGLWRASGGSRGGKLKNKFPLWRHFTNPARPSAAACTAPTPLRASRRGSVRPWSRPFAWTRAPTLLLQPSSRWSSSARNLPRLLVAFTSTRRLEPSPGAPAGRDQSCRVSLPAPCPSWRACGTPGCAAGETAPAASCPVAWDVGHTAGAELLCVSDPRGRRHSSKPSGEQLTSEPHRSGKAASLFQHRFP